MKSDVKMRSAEDLLQELTTLDESHRIEAKRCTKVDRSIMETVSAFANEPGLGGGYLLLGVVRDPDDMFGTAYQVVGIENPDKIQSDVASQCATTFNRPVRPIISVEAVQGKAVIVVYVPESAATDKPIYITNLGLPRGAFRRVGPTDQQSSEDDLIALYMGHQVETYDSSLLPDTDITDIDPDALNEYRRLRAKVNSAAEELSWSDEDLLRSLGAVVKRGVEIRPTVAGILLFGTSMALRRCFPMMRIDYIRVPGRQWVEDPEHRFDQIEIRAPLLLAIRRAENAVRDELTQSFSLPEGALAREDEPALPLRVIREAIVNSVMHRSYRIHGATQIIRYANRIEIRNPGHSIKTEEQLGEPGSQTRNPKIAAVLHDLNIAETKGSGIRAMRELMIQHNLLPPTFESTRQPDQFVATFLFHHFLGTEDIAWLRAITPETLTDEESRALIFVREVGAIDNAAYRSINRTDTLNASTHLRRLRDLELLTMKGSGSQTYYVPGRPFASTAASVHMTQMQLSEDNLDGMEAETGQNRQPDTQTHQASVQTHQVTAQTHQVSEQTYQHDQHTHQAIPALPQGIIDRLPTEGTRPRRSLISQLIRDICTVQPMSARDLASLLRRQDHKHLVKEFLTPMVAEGLLAYTIPKMEKHPDQKYTIPSSIVERNSEIED